MVAAKQDDNVSTWAQYLPGRMDGSWDQSHREERYQIHQTWEGKENREACVKHLSGTKMDLTLSNPEDCQSPTQKVYPHPNYLPQPEPVALNRAETVHLTEPTLH